MLLIQMLIYLREKKIVPELDKKERTKKVGDDCEREKIYKCKFGSQ